MDNEKLKTVLALLSGIIFSLIFILLAFVLPLKEHPADEQRQAKHTLEQISKGIKEGQLHPPPDEKLSPAAKEKQ